MASASSEQSSPGYAADHNEHSNALRSTFQTFLPMQTHAVANERVTAVLLRFAVQSSTGNEEPSDSAQACPKTDASAAEAQLSPNRAVDPRVLDAITRELEKRLVKKMNVLVNPAKDDVPDGAWIINGCVTRASGGNAAGRLVGMNIGSSHLGLHVILLRKNTPALSQVDQFDLAIRGGYLLSPLGPIGLGLHLATDSHKTLSADARKLADRILKRVVTDIKASD